MQQNKSLSNLLQDSKPSKIILIELILVLILLATGFTLRAWDLSNIGIDHFDEGVYAFSALGITDSNQPARLYPQQIRFSPPVFFSLVGLSYWFSGGPSDTAVVFINILIGTLTIALVWWVGRTWFSKSAGIGAATLLTFSEYHIALSRSALTDVAYAFFFLVALASIVYALRCNSVWKAVLAGLAVGLAWNTKYHGWFALLISGGALFLYGWFQRIDRASILRYIFLWLIIAVVAAACYFPWFMFIQSQPGGYTKLARYQRTMLSLNWFQNLWHHVQMQYFIEGILSRLSVFLAMFSVILVSAGRSLKSNRSFILLGLLGASTLLIGISGTSVLLVLLSIPALLRKPVKLQNWLILIWLALWFCSAPIYRPYARLLLPFTIAAYLVSGFWMSRLLGESQRGFKSVGWSYGSIAIGTTAVLGISLLLPNYSNPWRQSKSVAEAARSMKDFIPSGSRVIVIGQPELAYYLHLSGRPAFEKMHDTDARLVAIEKLTTPVYVVTGIYSNRAQTIRDGLKRLKNRLEYIESFSMDPKDLRVLDDFSPRDAKFYRQNPDNTYDLRLYLFTP